MEVILKSEVARIGKAGDVVKVKPGFARNFLIPRGLAVAFTASSQKNLEQEKQRDALRLEKLKEECAGLRERLQAISLTISGLTQDEDKLYGSVSARDIASAVKEEGLNLNEECILLDEPIKKLGIYEVGFKLHPEVSGKLKVWVVRK